ncbi:MAG TPA: hypothetical protein VF062_28155 [Candidatus Limnocylindrales bacterium]
MGTHQEKSIARWGSLAGISGSLLFLAIFVMVAVLAGPDPAGPGGPISRFPEIRAARTVENALCLAVVVLWVPLSLALLYRLRRTHPAAALFGTSLNLLGLAVFAAEALPHVATVGLSNRFHAASATAPEKEALVMQWQAAQGIFDAMLISGLFLMAAGITIVGVAMFSFGRLAGSLSLALGLTSLTTVIVTIIDPDSLAIVLGVFAIIGFHLLAGMNLHRDSS